MVNFGLWCWPVRAPTLASQTNMGALVWASPALTGLGLTIHLERFGKQNLTMPSISPLFLLKDQFFMVLVLIVFIVFKSVFLYVEGNNFLNTNR